MKYLADTDLLIGYLRENSQAKEFVTKNSEELALTTLTLFELIEGVFRAKKDQEKLFLKVLSLAKKLSILKFDEISSIQAGRISADLYNKGEPIGTVDTLIAGVAISRNLTLVTMNIKHFSKIKDLKIETW